LGVSNVPLYAAADIPVLFGGAGRMTHGTERTAMKKFFAIAALTVPVCGPALVICGVEGK